jgi:hypothetical protein
METIVGEKYRGPHAGLLAVIFTVLFNLGLYFVISLSGKQPDSSGKNYTLKKVYEKGKR